MLHAPPRQAATPAYTRARSRGAPSALARRVERHLLVPAAAAAADAAGGDAGGNRGRRLLVPDGGGVHGSLRADVGVVALAQEVHLHLVAVGPPLRSIQVAERQALAGEAAPRPGGGEPDDLARLGAPDRLVPDAVDRLPAHSDLELHLLARGPALLLDLAQRVAAHEVTLVELQEAVEARLERIVILRDVLAEEPHALLNAEGVHGGASPVAQLRVHLLQPLIELRHLWPLDVELKAVLANERHPDGNRLGAGQRELPPLEGLEGGARQVHWLVQKLLPGRLGVWAVDEEHGALARDVLDLDGLALL
mmetsp:Transcript_97139/g.302426  ORF Transcript_97139/g.302426 Transcript_97139/m.302426 type:complete len:308 (-) Transcript_97139:1678-2601(-)